MKKQNSLNSKNKLLWSLVFLLIAAGTVYAVMSQSKHFSLGEFRQFLADASPAYIAMAIACMLGFIVFEGLAIFVICRQFQFKCSPLNSFVYSATDIYFSAITPSATGGQPACGYFMVKDGIPALFTTVALVTNLAAYALSTLTLGLVSLLARPGLLMKFSLFSRVLIYLGYGAQIALIVCFTLMLKKKNIVHSVCRFGVRLAGKLHLSKRAQALEEKLEKKMEDYEVYSQMVRGKRSMLLWVVLFNILQKASQVAVTMFCFLAAGGKASEAFNIFCLQSYTTIGVNCIPIPGAMGITDYLMLDCFGSVMSPLEATNLELLSRSLSFYCCVIICGATVVGKIIQQRVRRTK